MQSASTIRKRRLTPAQRAKLVSAYRRGRLSQREFARQAGLGLSTLQLWLRKAVPPSAESSASFIQIPNVLAPPAAAGPYRLHLPGAVVLEIGAGFAAEELAGLLPLLRGLCSR